jgi:hypothetical protein
LVTFRAYISFDQLQQVRDRHFRRFWCLFFRHGSEIVEGEFREKKGSSKQALKDIGSIAKQIQGGMR